MAYRCNKDPMNGRHPDRFDVRDRQGMLRQNDRWNNDAEGRIPGIDGLDDRHAHDGADVGHLDSSDLITVERQCLGGVMIGEAEGPPALE